MERSRRYYQIAGITIQVEADRPITGKTFAPKFTRFEVEGPGPDTISIRHHFQLPEQNGNAGAQEIYRQSPWAIYHGGDSWIYHSIAPNPDDPSVHKVVIFNEDHTHGEIYHQDDQVFCQNNLHSLTLLPTDQILLARVLADRQGCYLHAAGMVLNGQGLLFVGHSEAGKSTMVTMLRNAGEILCDDRVILRRWPEGFRIHGTWSHGDVPEVSAAQAPLRAILFLEKATTNRLTPITDRREVTRTLPFMMIKPLVTPDWWEKMVALIGQIAREVPAYRLQFDKSGAVKQVIQDQLLARN